MKSWEGNGQPIIVYSVSNGYAVEPLPPKQQLGLAVHKETMHFPTARDLIRWLEGHIQRSDAPVTSR